MVGLPRFVYPNYEFRTILETDRPLGEWYQSPTGAKSFRKKHNQNEMEYSWLVKRT